jgi:hypothetical protein
MIMRGKHKPIGRMPDGGEIRLESQDEISEYGNELEEILSILGYPGALITDGSLLAHFFVCDDDDEMSQFLREIAKHFDIKEPNPDESLVEIARRARNAHEVRGTNRT